MKLQSKFLGVLVPAALLATGAVLFLISRSVHTVVMDGLERGSFELAASAAREAAQGFASRREDKLLPMLQELQHRQSALYTAALDGSGRVLAHTTVTEAGKVKDDPFTLAALSAGGPIAQRSEVRGEPALLVAMPVWAPMAPSEAEEFLMSGGPGPARARLGTLVTAVPMAAELETEGRIIGEVTVIVLAIGAVAFGLVFLLLRGMLGRIQGLMAGVARLGGGRYDVQVPVLSHDELGELAASFNRMSGELARTTVSKEYVEGVLENMYDLLLVTDTQRRLQTINRAAAGVLGDAGVIGRPLAELFEPMPEGEVVRDAEVVLRAKDGGRLTVLFSSSILRDREGGLLGYIVVAKDITQRKRSEEAVLAAKLAAEAAGRELETFSYSVAHDLRAPLRAIDGFSQILLDDYAGQVDAAGKDYLARVRAGSRKMGRLIDDLLNLSRITRGAVNLASVDLSALAGEIAADLRKGEPDRRVEFAVAPGLSVRGDPDLLRVALVNLLGNSWKYTSKHPAARIEFGAEGPEGRRVYFVRDDGAGFDMAFAKKLFQAFTRLHKSSEFEGTGIGLATVARVIARHEGRIWAEGAPERGAVFYFTLWEGKS